jgi:hypothetical protein
MASTDLATAPCHERSSEKYIYEQDFSLERKGRRDNRGRGYHPGNQAAFCSVPRGFHGEPAKPNDKPGIHLVGIPVEALAGIGLVVGGFMGLGGSRWSDHLTHLGNGALAAWTSNLGRGWGFKFRSEKKAAGGATKGEGGDSLRDQVAALLEGEDE